MPRLSAFYGIVITMYYGEEHPLPHFHARYGDSKASYTIAGCRLLAGQLPPRAHRMVRSWSQLHADELAICWQRARAEQPIGTIDPLP